MTRNLVCSILDVRYITFKFQINQSIRNLSIDKSKNLIQCIFTIEIKNYCNENFSFTTTFMEFLMLENLILIPLQNLKFQSCFL